MKDRFETFTVLINRISRNIKKIKNQEMAEYNLRSAHISCLYYLYSAGSTTATQLCEYCAEDKATISRAVESLESCNSQTAKRYKCPLFLTPKGEEVGEKIALKIQAVLDNLGDELTEKERLDLYKGLDIISKRLEKVAERRS